MTASRTSYVIAILDANVLYSAPLRDFFMWQAANGVFAARWTDAIHDEWIENLLDDRHVLAAAIECDAAYIVTENLDDFPERALIPHGIEAVSPDEFGLLLIEQSLGPVLAAAAEHRKSLLNPPKTHEEYVAVLAKSGLPQTSRVLSRYAERSPLNLES